MMIIDMRTTYFRGIFLQARRNYILKKKTDRRKMEIIKTMQNFVLLYYYLISLSLFKHTEVYKINLRLI